MAKKTSGHPQDVIVKNMAHKRWPGDSAKKAISVPQPDECADEAMEGAGDAFFMRLINVYGWVTIRMVDTLDMFWKKLVDLCDVDQR